MKRFALWMIVVAICACSRPSTTPVGTVDVDELERRGDIAADFEIDSSDTGDSVTDVNSSDGDGIDVDVGPNLCTATNELIPAEGSPCEVEGQRRCAREEAVEVENPGKGLSYQPWFGHASERVCHRPRRIVCTKGTHGSLSWVGEYCYKPYQEYAFDGDDPSPEDIQVLVSKFTCQDYDDDATCCFIGGCEPKLAGMTWCSNGKCQRLDDMPEKLQELVLPTYMKPKMPAEIRRCLMWVPWGGCKAPQCLICKHRPEKDIQCQCGTPTAKCEQISPYEVKCVKDCENYGHKQDMCLGNPTETWD